MSTLERPLVCVVGTTGTGKSQLAVDLALSLSKDSSRWKGGRVINADAMQVYAGLDIATNKVTHEEMNGVDHRLLGFRLPGEDEYFVSEWVKDAIKEIDECHSDAMIPIVTGGTAYWVQHLIFSNRLVSLDKGQASSSSDSTSLDLASLSAEMRLLFDNLPDKADSDSCSEAVAFDLHSLLCQIDPETGSRWHWKDTRKVLRSLSVIKETGRRASEVMIEQDGAGTEARYPTLIFWLYASPEVLNPRLDQRVDAMVDRGMLDEIIATRNQVQPLDRSEGHPPIDYTAGIFQTIGFKEFDAYLSSPDRPDSLLKESIETMKHSTRKYAQRQVKWIRHKLAPEVVSHRGQDPPVELFLLDATDISRWSENVYDPAVDILAGFLDLQPLKDAASLSETAAAMLGGPSGGSTSAADALAARRRIVCEACTDDPMRPVMIEVGKEWEIHSRSRTHRNRAGRDRRKGQQMEERDAKRLQRAMLRGEVGSAAPVRE